eukprot:GEMP01017484.1.p1 GENE.GEMP01017484.1~~GEMP01017484.1.p1  ORF type:complete len:452 (-),score=78.87 GEMP01017484.1:1304-2659(-)
MIIQCRILVLLGLLPICESNHWVDDHNVFRCMHGMPEVTWNHGLAQGAQDWGIRIHGKGLDHAPKDVLKGAGENLASGSSTGYAPKEPSEHASNAVEAWYNEIRYWGNGRADWNPTMGSNFHEAIGHMTQVLWHDTNEIGCYGKVVDNNGETVHTEVCRYLPGGNVQGQFPNKLPKTPTPVKTKEACEKEYRQGRGGPAPQPDAGARPEDASNVEKDVTVTAADKEFLRGHNIYRCMLGIPGVTWSTELTEYATKLNERHNGNGLAKHSDAHTNVNAGENLAYGYTTPMEAITAWYNERLDQSKPGAVLGHFTAMAWFDVTEIGCSDYKKSQWCNYRSGPERGGIAPNYGDDKVYEQQVVWTETRSRFLCEGAVDAGYGTFHASPFGSDSASAAKAGFIVMIILSVLLGLTIFVAGYMQFREYTTLKKGAAPPTAGGTRRNVGRSDSFAME